MSTQVLIDRPSIFAHVFTVPLPSLLRMGLVLLYFFGRYLGVCIFILFLGLQGSHMSTEKTQEPKDKTIRKRLGGGALNTCVKFPGQSLHNGVESWTFVR